MILNPYFFRWPLKITPKNRKKQNKIKMNDQMKLSNIHVAFLKTFSLLPFHSVSPISLIFCFLSPSSLFLFGRFSLLPKPFLSPRITVFGVSTRLANLLTSIAIISLSFLFKVITWLEVSYYALAWMQISHHVITVKMHRSPLDKLLVKEVGET